MGFTIAPNFYSRIITRGGLGGRGGGKPNPKAQAFPACPELDPTNKKIPEFGSNFCFLGKFQAGTLD